MQAFYRTNLTHVAALINFIIVFYFIFLFLREKDLVLVVTVFVASKLACLCSVVKRELNECGSLLPQFVK
jgi:hypothetical protein